MMKRFIIRAAFGLAAVLGGVAASTASAQWYSDGYGWYYGRGGHDVVPHWHDTVTPFGTFSWYGRSEHDYRPHLHEYNPYSYYGYSDTPFGYTRSYYPRYPYYYSWW